MAGPPVPGTYELNSTYRDREQQYPRYRYALDPRYSKLLADTTSPTLSPTQRPVQKNFLEEGLSFLGRPLQATSSALAYGLQGKNPLEGAWEGLQGQTETHGIADVLTQQGVPEMGKLNLGPLEVTGRGALGFGLDLLADPLSYIGAKPLSLIGKGGELAATAGRTLGPSVAETGAQMFAPSAVRTLAQKATKVPLVKGLLDRIDPRMANSDPVKQAVQAYEAAEVTGENIARTRVAQFTDRIPFQLVDKGQRIQLGGDKVAWGDVFMKPQDYKLNPEQLDYIGRYQQEAQGWSEEAINRTGAFQKRTMMEGEEYVPRRPIKEAAQLPDYVKIPVGAEKTLEKARDYHYMEQGLEAGLEYADPIETMRRHVKDALSIIHEDELRKVLEPYSKKLDLEKIKGLTTRIKQEKSYRAFKPQLEQYNDVKARMAEMEGPLAELEMEVEFGKIPSQFDRPKRMFVGWTDEELQEFATREGYNPYEAGWWKHLDPSATKEARGGRRYAGEKEDFLADTKQQYREMVAQYNELAAEKETLEKALGGSVRGMTPEDKLLAGQMRQGVVQEGMPGARPPIAGMERDLKAEQASIEGLTKAKGLPLFKDMYFSPGDVETINKYIGTKVNPTLKFINDTSSVARTVSSNFDLGAGMLQGLVLLARNPLAWARAQKAAVMAAVKPESLAKRRASADWQAVREQFPGLSIGNPEVQESLEAGGAFEKLLSKGEALPKVGKMATGLVSGTTKRFQSAFDAFGDTARYEMARALLPVAQRTGKFKEIEDFINKATGVMSSREWGISPNQRAVESGFLFFSPRYTRATLSLVGDALTNGGVAGDQARKSMAAMLAGGLSAYMKFAEATGQEPHLDPSQANFLTMDVGGENVGIGSVWVSLMRLMGKSITNPGSLTTADPQNPLVSWWRGRSAPLGSSALDLITGENYFGEELNSLPEYGGEVAKRFLPFAAQGVFEGQGLSAETFPAQMAGLRVFPQNYYERRQGMADTFAKETGATPMPFEEMSPFDKQAITQKLKDLKMPVKGDRNLANEQAFTELHDGLTEIAQYLAEGRITKPMWREAKQIVYAELGTKIEEIKKKFPETAGQTEARWAKMSLRERARELWLELLNKTDEAGNVLYEEADAFKSQLPADIQQYIDDTTAANVKNLPPEAQAVEQQWRRDKKVLEPYWDLQSEVLKERGLWDDYQAMTPAEREAFTQTRQYEAAQKIWERKREVMRRRDKEVDRVLQEWYGRVPLKPKGGSLASSLMPDLTPNFGKFANSLM